MIIRLADIIKKPAIMLIHIDEVLKDKPRQRYFFAGAIRVVKCKAERKEEIIMSKQVNTADEQDEIQHMDYIYMVNGDKLIIRMNAELDHHLAERDASGYR